MWIHARSMDGKIRHQIRNLSKLTEVSELRERIEELFDIPPDRQRLFCRGKQLEDGNTLFDYNIALNEMILVMAKQIIETEPKEENNNNDEKECKMEELELEEDTWNEDKQDTEETCDTSNASYRIGDIVDCRDRESGAWYEGEVSNIKKTTMETLTEGEDGFNYAIIYKGYEDDIPVNMPAGSIRPRAKTIVPITKLEEGKKYMVNYNPEFLDTRGLWYDAVVKALPKGRSKSPTFTVSVGQDLIPVDAKLMFPNEVFAIEEPGTQSNVHDIEAPAPVERTNKPNCDVCRDDPKKKCKECACYYCAGKNDANKTLLCDECDQAYHIFCLTPPLTEVPEVDEWFCPLCKNDESEVVMAGQQLKASKKKAKMASATTKSKRDWGRGMACSGRSSECTIVPKNHFGPVPGVDVGMSWRYRVGASECGVHRPHVAGIAGRGNEGAVSIVLSAGYEDDTDNGDTFTYTGSGGRDLSGNKRTAEQSSDQKLTSTNLALARNCCAKLDIKDGAKAGDDWRKGKPVRVLRNSKGEEHYAPEEGIRYDGIYKVIRYWPQRGKSGFIVWRYELRRDDEIPAPWTVEGKKRIDMLGYQMQVPDGYYEQQKEKEREKEMKGKGKGKGKKRKETTDEENSDPEKSESPPAKKKKVAKYELSPELSKLINDDEKNWKAWKEVLSKAEEGGSKFLATAEEQFGCICCMDVVCHPVTTECAHNICKSCITRSFKSKVYTCPMCRFDLGKDYKMTVNSILSQVLNKLFPGYETGR